MGGTPGSQVSWQEERATGQGTNEAMNETPHPLQGLLSKRQAMTNAGEIAEKEESPYTIGGNVN